MQSIYKRTANAVLVAVSVISGMFLMEGAVAFFLPQQVTHAAAPATFFVRYDEEIGWVNKEGADGTYRPAPSIIPDTSVRINKLGLRGKEIALNKNPRKKRILLLGDSNTFGYGMEEHQRFSEKLASLLPDTYEVVNMGVFGYGTDQEALLFERDGLRYQPDIVVLGFSAGDLSDNMNSINTGNNKPFFKIASGKLVLHNVPVPKSSAYLPSASRQTPWKIFFYNHSHLYRLILSRLSALNRYAGDSVREMEEEEGLDTTCAVINALNDLCRANNSKFAVLLISHDTWISALKETPDRPVGYYGLLKTVVTDLDIPVIDTTGSFVKHKDQGKPLFFQHDPVHLSAAGNTLVAEALYKGLLEHRLIETNEFRK